MVVPWPGSLSASTRPPCKLRDVLYDRKSEAGAAQLAAARFVHAIKPLENSRQILLADSDTGVTYAQSPSHRRVAGLQTNLAAFARIFHRVVEQVVEDFLQSGFVRANQRQIRRQDRQSPSNVFAANFCSQSRTILSNNIVERDTSLKLQIRIRRFQLRQAEQVVHEQAETLRMPLHHFQDARQVLPVKSSG